MINPRSAQSQYYGIILQTDHKSNSNNLATPTGTIATRYRE
jgi:hypothetical protein